MCPGPRQKRTFALLKATLTRVQALFSIRGTRGIAPFSTRMRFWRDTPIQQGQSHYIEDLLPAERLSVRYEDIYGAAQRAIRDDCLRRPQSDAADVLLPQALFQ